MSINNNNDVEIRGLKDDQRNIYEKQKTWPKLIPFTPLLIPTSLILICLITYFQAMYYGHVEPILPYISDAASTTPEAGYFSLILYLNAPFVIFAMYFRKKQIIAVLEHINQENIRLKNKKDLILILNNYSFISTIIASVGLILVASFKSTEQLFLHITGAIPVFGGIALILIIQTWLSLLLISILNTKLMAVIRIILTVLTIVSMMIAALLAIWSSLLFEKDPYSTDRLKWSSENKGYILHVISALGEWLTVMFTQIAFYTFYYELKLVTYDDGKVYYKILRRELQNQPI